MRFINFNGQIQSENIPVIHSWNRAFRYGDGLFESIAVANKTIPFLDDHWNRLASGAKLLSLDLSSDFTKATLQKSILELLSFNAIEGNAFARVMIYREGRGRYNPEDMQAGFVIEADALPGELFALNEKGLSLGLFTEVHKPIDKLSNFKTCSSLVYVLASVFKTKSALDDCAILNSKANICDSTNSNIFLVKGKSISTPSLEEGCINGVMRKQVIQLAKEKGFMVNEIVIETGMIREADEIFLTNAAAGIKWVASYGSKQFRNDVSKKLSSSIPALIS